MSAYRSELGVGASIEMECGDDDETSDSMLGQWHCGTNTARACESLGTMCVLANGRVIVNRCVNCPLVVSLGADTSLEAVLGLYLKVKKNIYCLLKLF